ncbi:hypothetical protein TDB9533_04418 [Thalassocella blandensis]|nr:hypothetical protein TDB9533_04418 [Thalassocella blandensis]
MKQEIENLRILVEPGIRFLYSAIAFHEALADEACVEKLNKNSDYWRLYESSTLSCVFMAIRKIYENKAHTFNFQNFLDKCIVNLEEFSINGVKDRKIKSGIFCEDSVKEYSSKCYEPNTDDFKEMGKFVRDRSKKMKGAYSTVASKVYAHAIHFSHKEALSANQCLNLYEIETALLSVWHCYEQVWQLYENGRQPSYGEPNYQYKQEVIEGVYRQINA